MPGVDGRWKEGCRGKRQIGDMKRCMSSVLAITLGQEGVWTDISLKTLSTQNYTRLSHFFISVF